MWSPFDGCQLAAFEADWCDILGFAGERGAGKSSYQLGWQEDGALRYGAAHRGIMTRKTYPEIEELQLQAMRIFPQEGAQYHVQPSARFPVSNCWYWPNGAQVRMRYLESAADYGRYHGHEFTRLSLDEVTEYDSPEPLLKMMSTLRSPHGIPCAARLTGNPGGVGHVWMKMLFKIGELVERTPFVDKDSGLTFMFVRGLMAQNKAINVDEYRRNILLATRGNIPLQRAWLKGDWDVVAGAFFSEWDEDVHVIRQFDIPADWPRFTSHDWGSYRPFSSGWYAIAPEATRWRNWRGERLVIPKGAIIRYRELYGMEEGQYNTGLKWSVERWSERVMELMGSEKMLYNIADPSMFKEDGGPSHAETAWKHAKLPLSKGDNERVVGWNQCRFRLDHVDSAPMFYVFQTCPHFRRTVPALQHDKLKLEDVDSDGEDHIGDEFRYACMSRPILREAEKPKVIDIKGGMSFDRMLALTDNEQVSRSKYRS